MSRLVTIETLLQKPDGSPWSNARFTFNLNKDFYTATNYVANTSVESITDATGKLSVELIDNSEGIDSSYYTVTYPTGRVYKFILNLDTPSPVELSVLIVSALPPTSPSYSTLLTELAIIGRELPEGGTLNDVLSINKLVPTKELIWKKQSEIIIPRVDSSLAELNSKLDQLHNVDLDLQLADTNLNDSIDLSLIFFNALI